MNDIKYIAKSFTNLFKQLGVTKYSLVMTELITKNHEIFLPIMYVSGQLQ